MKSRQLQQPSLTARHIQNRCWQWFGLLGLIAALALAFYGASVRASQAPLHPLLLQPAAIDPAMQSVNAYLRAHASVRQSAAIDPAMQSVNAYLRAHASVRQSAAIDPAMQSVNAYLRAHASVRQSCRVNTGWSCVQLVRQYGGVATALPPYLQDLGGATSQAALQLTRLIAIAVRCLPSYVGDACQAKRKTR